MEIGQLSTDQLEGELVRFEAVRRQSAAVMAALICEADRRQVPLADGCRNTKEWVAARLDATPQEASALAYLSKALQDLPETAQKLAEGEMSVARAHVVSTVATEESESEWHERLAGLNLAGAERVAARQRRISRKRERRTTADSYFTMQPSLDESWWKLSGAVGPVAGQVISNAVKTRADEFPTDAGDRTHRQALALEAICQDTTNSSGEGSSGSSSSGASITALVDLDSANDTGGETGAELEFGPRIGPDVLGELLCGGKVQLVGLSGGKPIVTSKRTATIPPAVRKYVLWRDGACRAPGCRSTYRLQPHHIVYRSHGGTHHPDNLVALCWYHHHVVVHRRGYRIETQPDGSIRFRVPADSRDPP